MSAKKIKKSLKISTKTTMEPRSIDQQDLKELAELKRDIDRLSNHIQEHVKKSPDKAGKVLADWMKSKRKKKAS